MMTNFYRFLVFVALCSLLSCQKHDNSIILLNDEQQFKRYLHLGDSIYATKSGINAFERSMDYFDSAMVIAQRTNDTIMLAEGIFAKGRVYDAWNHNQAKTIELFEEAAHLYELTHFDIVREYYMKHLVAHTFEKMGDSTRCVRTLHQLCESIARKPDSIQQKMDFIPQMAHISTIVKNYDLAEKILTTLYKRAWIKNNPKTYNFEDYYFLTRSRIDIFKYKNEKTPYLDSFALCLNHIQNPVDSMLYIEDLTQLYVIVNRFDKAYAFSNLGRAIWDRVNKKQNMESMRNRLETLEAQAEVKKKEAEAARQRNRTIILSILCVAMAIISFLLLRYRREFKLSQEKSKHLAELNEQLENKIQEVELSNKEVQHRIKNNLHLIFSLLNMQERKSDNPDTIENLQKARLRVESIAGLHDQLSQNDNKNVDFNAYINHLVETIIECVETDRKVITHVVIENITVPHNYFFSIGLILNEWITNSVKYAKTESSLVLTIKMQQKSDAVAIEYFDNGQVTNEVNPQSGLGSEIISLLTRQMKGVLTHDERNKYHYFLTIKNG